MIKKLTNYLWDTRNLLRLNIALSKGSAMMSARQVDLTQPATWEFSGFSQNGEDGIIDILSQKLQSPNRYFVEIGAADGIENNTAWLTVVQKYRGLMIEGNSILSARANRCVAPFSIGVECINMFVTKDTVAQIRSRSLESEPDVFSLDIDGNDFYIAKAILDSGIRPKIFVVEYNSVFGPDRSITIEYEPEFVYTTAHSSHLYYGVSISGWRKFFSDRSYKFVTVDRNGVNAFFVDSEHFDTGFLEQIQGTEFAENRFQYTKFRMSSEEQFALIADERYVVI